MKSNFLNDGTKVNGGFAKLSDVSHKDKAFNKSYLLKENENKFRIQRF